MPAESLRLAACTIVSANYIAFARVLARSFLQHHPDARFFTVLVDRVDGRFDPTREPFELLEIEDIDNLPDRDGFLFKYTLLECNTAVKPYVLEHLFDTHDFDTLLYLDPDILVARPLTPILDALTEHDVALTPHLTDPIDDQAHPGELAILQAGAYNLGFIGLRSGNTAKRLLTWWQARLFDRCVVRVEDGLFVDQKWIDLVPGLFGDRVRVLDEPGLNVAYWNLHGRRVTIKSSNPNDEPADAALVNGRPLYFFHFSGIDPEHLQPVSKHQDRFTLDDIGDAKVLYRDYARRVLDQGHLAARPWPYAFACFDNGAPIPAAARRLYLDLGERRGRFGNPFRVQAEDGGASFWDWLNAPRRSSVRPPYLSRLLHHLWSTRPDLQRIFPDPEGADLPELSAWMQDFGRHELGLHDSLLTNLHQDGRATLFTAAGLKRRLRNRAKRVYHSDLGRHARSLAKQVLGHARYDAARQRLKPAAPSVTDASGNTVSGAALGPYRLAPPHAIERVGVNVVGYLSAETGMGEAARSIVHALESAGIPHSLHDLDLNVLARRDDSRFAHATSTFPYDVNLFVVNADQVPAVREHVGGEVFGGRFNIGLWLWELERFPVAWAPAFDQLHEIWTPSTFCVDAISAASPLPVKRVPLAVAPAPPRPLSAADRERYGLRNGAFTFLYTFNFLSYMARKNPLAAIQAFRMAFGNASERADVQLVLKTSQSDFAPEARRALDEAIGEAAITVVDGYFDRAQTDALTDAADCYVSLHRSEGFGLTVAEAMALGTPVIATPYSGVADFFSLNNGFPVRYELVALTEDAGPYPAGARWAEPDIAHAAERMREVVEHPERARHLASRARADIATQLSYEAVGRVLQERFDDLVARVNRQQVGRVM